MSMASGAGIAVLKFGGTSVESADRIRDVVGIVAARAAVQPTVVVVSALAGVTNLLLEAAQRAARGDPSGAALIDTVRDRHSAAAAALAAPDELPDLTATIDAWSADLHSLLHGIALVHDCSPRVLDAVLAYGELFSSRIVAAALHAAAVRSVAVDARLLIVSDDTFGRAVVDRPRTNERVRQHLTQLDVVPVVTGFIAATEDGTTTTLGRGGSDYTATLLGAALHAAVVEIWTDVPGVMSADPRLVPQSFPLPRLSYTELMELSHFGAKVVYPPSVSPARDAGVPLVIRNTLDVGFPGTWVLPTTDVPDDVLVARRSAVCGISSINSIALCRLEGGGMVGVPGIASRLFGALARDDISVILISQASSEHSICFAIEPANAARARRRIDAEFELERRAGAVDPLVVEEDYAIVAAVGEAMRETPGIAGRLFDVLGRNGINVRAIAQGSSELNISAVVARTDEERALRLIHDAFFFPRTRVVQVFIAGVGRVGAALLDQLAAESARVGDRLGLRLIVGGIARRNTCVLRPDGVPLGDWRTHVEQASEPAAALITAALGSPNAHRVFVDCTASATVTEAYEALLRNGIAIVTANKIALSGPTEPYQRLRLAGRHGNGLYSETTVGAGLPVLRPIADLVATGDAIARIEGVLSGTLSFLLGNVMAGVPFSEAVREAHARGFTEPDPRDDLSGRDVARKLLILGREAGFDIEPEQIQVEPLLPDPDYWATLTLERFWDDLPAVDAHFAQQRDEVRAAGGTLCYLGTIDGNGAHVALRALPHGHACAALSPGDNLIAVTSARYTERPLIIRGPGAGPDVTAAGVFADILRAGVESR